MIVENDVTSSCILMLNTLCEVKFSLLSIKEVKKRTGVTVRTLRYYDQIGLLLPAGKTEGGHRLYGERELIKLQEIQFLKSLGFSLGEIKEMLSNERNWTECLQDQLTFVSNEKKKLEQMEMTLQGLLNEIAIDGEVDLLKVQHLIKLYTKDPNSRDIYRKQVFNESEVELLRQLPNINRTDPDTLEWISLLAQLKKHMDKGPEAPQIKKSSDAYLKSRKKLLGITTNFWKRSGKSGSLRKHRKRPDFIRLNRKCWIFLKRLPIFI